MTNDNIDTLVTEVQTLYPQIYQACHTEHVRAASSRVHLSSRDSAVLAHLAVAELAGPAALARHLNIRASTLSEAVATLSELGYVRSKRDPQDGRKQILQLTPTGLEAMKKASVLDSDKLTRLMQKLSPAERIRAVRGLALLARAAREIRRPTSRKVK